ncbi:MAG: glycoside hydrolase family 43 protein, partial [Gaiellaceae bacterium]
MSEQRPILPGLHPDPSVCRVDDTFFLACSSFEYFPGVPLYRSHDLKTWEQIGHVLDRPSQLDVSRAGPSGGVFAPTLRHHDGRFWLITTNTSDGGYQLLVHATDAAGPWSGPVRIPAAVGIDPDLAWDGGTCLLTYADQSLGPQTGAIVQAALDPETGTLLGEPKRLWSGTGGRYPEAPHLYRRGDTWYLMLAEGGTERAHSVTIARGPSPSGPFEACPNNPILTHRGLNRSVQNTGHADLVERADGSWAVVYLGVRPSGESPQYHVLGRETFAQEVEWIDGWPVLTEQIAPPAAAPAVHSDDFDDERLSFDWVSPGCPPSEIVSLDDPPGWLTVRAGERGPAFVGRRQEHLCCSVRALVDASAGCGGLSLRIDPRHHYDLELSAGELRVVAQIGPVCEVVARTAAVPELASGAVGLRLDVVRPDAGPFERTGPDTVVLRYETDGGAAIELARLDGRYLSTEVAGGFTGRFVGIYASTGVVRVD